MQAQTTLAIAENVPPPLALLQMATGYWISRAIYVAARLRIADLLEDGPMTCLELAEATAAHPDSLRRLMRAVASSGVFATDDNYTFGLSLERSVRVQTKKGGHHERGPSLQDVVTRGAIRSV